MADIYFLIPFPSQTQKSALLPKTNGKSIIALDDPWGRIPECVTERTERWVRVDYRLRLTPLASVWIGYRTLRRVNLLARKNDNSQRRGRQAWRGYRTAQNLRAGKDVSFSSLKRILKQYLPHNYSLAVRQMQLVLLMFHEWETLTLILILT